MHAESFAEQQREEQVSLVAERQPGQARLARAWLAVKASTFIVMSGSAPSVLGWA
jgi:hypothetical protein